MDPLLHPYHHYLFFDLTSDFYQQPKTAQSQVRDAFAEWCTSHDQAIIYTYATRSFQTDSVFMLWVQAKTPEYTPALLGELYRTSIGPWLALTATRFGIVRPSQYSGRTGEPQQVIQNYTERLPYFIVYPFTKTIDWHLLEYDARRQLMGGHIRVGLQYPKIRQCLLYSYGVDDDEFVVSYEAESLEHFQDLVIELRKTEARRYTLRDTPIYTCLYMDAKKLAAWL